MYLMKEKAGSQFYCVMQRMPLILLMIWLVLLIPLYLPNMGGSGLKLPMNILTWGMIAAITVGIWISISHNKPVYFGSTTRIILLAIMVLFLPLLFTQSQWYDTAGSRWAALMAGALFTLSLRQYSLFQERFRWVLTALLFAITLQAVIATGQLFTVHRIPDYFAYPMLNGRPYGVFQQVNLLASFIATGLALVLGMFCIPGMIPAPGRVKMITNLLLAALLVLFTALLVWLQSRIGWLGGCMASLLLLAVGFRVAPKKAALAAGLTGAGIVLALIVKSHGALPSVTHADSNYARLIILQDTLKMIAARPFLGWGYGSFEFSFQHFRAAQHLSTLGLGVVRHPHNEILLWWVEGGMVALCGMLVLIAAGAHVLWRACRIFLTKYGHKSSPLPLALIGILLPMLLHTQTEFPFTSSAPHWAVFLMLAALLAGQLNITPQVCIAPCRISWIKVPVIVLSLAALGLFSYGLYANLVLNKAERHQFRDFEHTHAVMKYDLWINRERWQYDKNLHDLLVFNNTRNIKNLYLYQLWAEQYLLSRIDRNVYGNLVGVLALLKDDRYQQIKREASIMFPDDKRFDMEEIKKKQEVTK